MNLVYGDGITEWVKSRMPNGLGFDNPWSIGIIKQSSIIAGVTYDNYRPAVKSVCVSIAIDDKTALTRGILRQLFSYPFNNLQVKRLTCMVDDWNEPSQALARQLGFVQEGILRSAGINDNDLLVFGMLRNECRWLSNSLKNT